MRGGLLLTVTNSFVLKLLIKTAAFELNEISKPGVRARPLCFLLKKQIKHAE